MENTSILRLFFAFALTEVNHNWFKFVFLPSKLNKVSFFFLLLFLSRRFSRYEFWCFVLKERVHFQFYTHRTRLTHKKDKYRFADKQFLFAISYLFYNLINNSFVKMKMSSTAYGRNEKNVIDFESTINEINYFFVLFVFLFAMCVETTWKLLKLTPRKTDASN